MTNSKPGNFLANKNILAEIHKSKTSYCYYIEERYSDYDAIAKDLSEITDEFLDEVRLRKSKPWGQPETELESREDLVIRVYTNEHIPLENMNGRRKIKNDLEKISFIPFKHYIKRDNELIEVCRSHWVGGFDNGYFSTSHGQMTTNLAKMIMLMVAKYSKKGNWSGYSYLSEFQGAANAQLCHAGLQFDESKSDNPFAYYTQIMKNSFTKVLNNEKKNQDIRDDLIEMSGGMPSYTRQFNNTINS